MRLEKRPEGGQGWSHADPWGQAPRERNKRCKCERVT